VSYLVPAIPEQMLHMDFWLDSVLSFLSFSYKALTTFLFMLNVHVSCLSFGFDLKTGGFLQTRCSLPWRARNLANCVRVAELVGWD
jgi:hypothetical protein